MLDEKEKARLAWHCRRGMLELDLILQKFLKNHLDQLSPKQIRQFDGLLHHTDPELFSWFMGFEMPENEEIAEIVSFIRNSD